MTDQVPAPLPYTTLELGVASASGGFHLYIVDANGRKIAAIWGRADEKVWTADLLTRAANSHADALELLHWMNRKGGLGHDVHERIRVVLDKLEGK